MRFYYGKQDMHALEASESRCVMLTNGLGGYASVTAGYSVNRCDQGILIAAVRAPNERITLVHRTRESITVGEMLRVLEAVERIETSEETDGNDAAR